MIASRPPTTSAAAAADDEQPPQPPPSVLRGLVVRLKYAGTYHLLPVEQLFAAADGKPGLAVASPDPQQQHGAPLRVQLNSASGTNPLADDQWDAAGRAEVEQLAALLQQRGQPLSVAEVAAAAWRKQAALAWHAQHGALPPSEQQQHLPELLQQLADEEAIAELQQQGWYGESGSPPRHHINAGSMGLGGRPGRLPSRSPSPRRREWRGPVGEPPLVPAAVCHFKFGNTIRWELVGREVFVSGLPTCDGERMERRVVAHRLANLIEGTGAAVEGVKINSGDARGDLAYVTLGSARQAARAIELLQGAEREGQQEWLLTGRQVEISGLRDSGDEAAMWQQIMPLVGAAGGTVTDRRVAGGDDSRGPLMFLTLATAQQAAAVIECLQAVEVEGGQLYLRPSQGPTTVSWLFGELGAVPPPCGPLNTTLLRHFLDRRPHLFRLDRGEQVEAAEGAAAVLRYKRELLQYLGSRPPQGRVTAEQLDSQMAPPSGLPSHLASKGAVHFVREILWREAEVVTVEPSVVAVELRPFLLEADECLAARNAGYQLPTFSQPCRFFFQLNGTRASCTHGLRCRFVHARERADFT
ncbi:RNA binding rggm [Chlorella sorokiniana]|uniref:RNA binding rggm n=1 Tax=Chlorella sorokiniana TaxID=3076 RepID=A0A2P6TV62_CHLSO|nr:RNA binding rggm [Chlorella sorokiniana]|eukprot:PRW57934.1 RNA binding rggm [Chlorella sorokiniana]